MNYIPNVVFAGMGVVRKKYQANSESGKITHMVF
jgi:hypothetical protein